MRIHRRPERGFTLIEALLTVAMTAVVVGMSMVVMVSARDLWFEQQARSAAARDGWMFIYKLCRELREAMPPAQLGEGAEWRGASAQVGLLDAVGTAGWPESTIEEMKAKPVSISDGAIRFPTLRVRSAKEQPRPGMVEYSLKRDENRHVVGIMRRAAQMGVPWSAAEGGVESPSVVSLGFEYLGADGGWQPEWKDVAAMPRAVRITVGSLVRPSRRVKMPVVTRFSTLIYMPTDSRIPQ